MLRLSSLFSRKQFNSRMEWAIYLHQILNECIEKVNNAAVQQIRQNL